MKAAYGGPVPYRRDSGRVGLMDRKTLPTEDSPHAWLYKPFSPQELLDTIDRVLRPCPLQRPGPVEHFTGRKWELSWLPFSLAPSKVVVLYGLDSIGKSSLAIETLWRLARAGLRPSAFPDGIIAHDFRNTPQTAALLENICSAYRERRQPTLKDAAQRVLAEREALLFLDHVEAASDLQTVLDIRGKCGVLATSPTTEGITADQQVHIDHLPSDEGGLLLRSCAEKSWTEDWVIDTAVAQHISGLVGGSPLTLKLVGHYLARNGGQAEAYLSWLKASALQDMTLAERCEHSVSLVLEHSLTQVSDQARKALVIIGRLPFAPFLETAVIEELNISYPQIHHVLLSFE
jgi:hypothetical protein